MSVPIGKSVYQLGDHNCTGHGLVWSMNEFDVAMDAVAEILFDVSELADIAKSISDAEDAGFVADELRRVLSIHTPVEDWRVGEAIAEAYLTSHRSCVFPWATNRDIRKRGSSLPGADLVGFSNDHGGYCFAFGEVKTSSENRHPPRAMHGPTGLRTQIEDLRDEDSSRAMLVQYLAYRVLNTTWQDRFKAAVNRYLNDSTDVCLFGVLVRDVHPHPNDLKACVDALAEDGNERTVIDVLALYLPTNCIEGIGTTILTRLDPNR